MKRDKPWRPNDYPAPLLHIVEPDEPFHDPDLTDAQAERMDKILALAFGSVMAVVVLVVIVAFFSHAVTGR